MNDENYKELLERTGSIASEFLRGLRERPVGRTVDFESLLEGFGDELPAEGEDSLRVIEELWRLADPGRRPRARNSDQGGRDRWRDASVGAGGIALALVVVGGTHSRRRYWFVSVAPSSATGVVLQLGIQFSNLRGRLLSSCSADLDVFITEYYLPRSD